jgi:hypothetical protein
MSISEVVLMPVKTSINPFDMLGVHRLIWKGYVRQSHL